MNKFSKISMDEYKIIPALSSHDLMTVIKHPNDWQKYLFEGYHDPVDEKLRARFDVGTLFHTMVLEPELLEKEYWFDRGQEWPLKDIHKQIVYADGSPVFIGADYTYNDLVMAKDQILASPDAAFLMFNLDKAEHSTDFKCPRTGLYFRGRPDAILKDGSVVDLKTASRNDEKSFMRSVDMFHYDMQAAFYCDVCETKDFYWIACSLKSHTVEVYKATDKQLGKGWEKNEYAKKRIMEYLNG